MGGKVAQLAPLPPANQRFLNQENRSFSLRAMPCSETCTLVNAKGRQSAFRQASPYVRMTSDSVQLVQCRVSRYALETTRG